MFSDCCHQTKLGPRKQPLLCNWGGNTKALRGGSASPDNHEWMSKPPMEKRDKLCLEIMPLLPKLAFLGQTHWWLVSLALLKKKMAKITSRPLHLAQTAFRIHQIPSVQERNTQL